MIANAQAVHTQRWARALSERGYTVTLISIRNAVIPGVKVLPRSVGQVDGAKIWPLLSYIRLLLTLPLDLHRIRPDIINPQYCITHGTIAALTGARPRIVNVWGSDLIWDGTGPIPWWRKALIRFSLQRADAIVSTSQFMADAVEQILPAPPPITLVPFGVDTSRFKPSAGQKTHSKVRIGFVKSFAKKYAPDIFVEAAAIAARERPDIEFTMAGRGRLLNQIRNLAAERGLGDRISFPGFIAHDDVAEFMRRIDILVNCSRSESFGVVICEASATGIPVIVTDVGGVRETLKDGQTGILVPRDDIEALAAAMLKLAADPDLRMRMGQAGRAFIRDKYEWDGCVKRFETALESL